MMPDQAPPAPEGCVYGPWWDGYKQSWFYRDHRGMEYYHVLGKWQLPRNQEGSNRELLRLAKENAELRAENERLTSVIEKGHEEWRMNAE